MEKSAAIGRVSKISAPADKITVLAIVDAIEGHKPLFACQEVRGRCAIFEGDAPRWATKGVCAIHAVMLRAEQSMREALAQETLAGLAQTLDRKAPHDFGPTVVRWLNRRNRVRRKEKDDV